MGRPKLCLAGTPTEARLRDMVEEQCLRDKQVARAFHCAPSTVIRWRHLLGISAVRYERFPASFEKRHGKGSIQRFIDWREEGTSLAAIGRAFGITRERARQVEKLCIERGLLFQEKSSPHR